MIQIILIISFAVIFAVIICYIYIRTVMIINLSEQVLNHSEKVSENCNKVIKLNEELYADNKKLVRLLEECDNEHSNLDETETETHAKIP